MPVFTVKDHEFFKQNGYVIVPRAVPQEDLDALLALIDEHVGLAPETWYKPPHHEGSFIEIYHQQALWNTRQRPRVVEAFRELLGSPTVHVTTDRVSMKLPMHPDHPKFGGALPIHWDIPMKIGEPPSWNGLQGVLAITDTNEDMGGFACVPGSHLRVDELVARQDADFKGWMPAPAPDIAGQAIPMRAGDLLIWSALLLHGSLANRSKLPRFAQYIGFARAPQFSPKALNANIAALEAFTPLGGWHDNPQVNQPRQWAGRPSSMPRLTELGRAVAGIEPW